MKEKGELVARMKRRIISTLLAGMSAHRDEETMMRNGCLALCQFRIPQDVVRVLLSTFYNLLLSISHCRFILLFILLFAIEHRFANSIDSAK